MKQTQAILVLPHLRIQNANAIGSPLTHGFPSITAFTGVMWALERKLAEAGVPLQLHGVGVQKRRFLQWELGAAEIARQRAIKALFDPSGIMNPGKVY